MTGIVIVCHSEKLAEGVKDIIQMMASEVPVALAGGHVDGTYGVCVSKVRSAFKEMRIVDNALIFVDLGSALTVVEDVLGEFPAGKFEIMDCPLVEGAVGAAVVASGGAPLKDVIRIARETRNAFKF
ncbi:MAG: dihydroxyacetone kinase [Eubacteriales bacterium]|nr:dihydroxyacetone kinase [Eubacteriales bacterium]